MYNITYSLISFQGQLLVKENLGSLHIARMKKGKTKQQPQPEDQAIQEPEHGLFITSFILFDIISPLEQSLEEPNVD